MFYKLLEKSILAQDVLEKYAHKKDVFIQFSNELKLGIKPFYGYDFTPVGIYGYPLELIWDSFKMNKPFFGGDRKYIHIFELKNEHNILYASQYTSNDYNKDKEKIQKILNRHFKNNEDLDWESESFKTDLMKHIDYSDAETEPFKQLFILVKAFSDFLASYHNTNKLVIDVSSTRSSVVMNFVYRKILNYYGIVDDVGRQITSDIPFQAVFFSLSPLKQIQTINNITTKENPETYKIFHQKVSDEEYKQALLNHMYLITKIKNMPLDLQLSLVSENPTVVAYIQNPAEIVIWKALKSSEFGSSIKFIIRRLQSKLTQKMKLWIIANHINYFPLLTSVSSALQYYAVTKHPEWFYENRDSVNDLDEKAQLYLIQKYPEIIASISRPSLEAQLFVVKKNPEYFYYINYPFQEVKELYNREKANQDEF